MRIVVKVGTSTLTHATGRLNIRHVETQLPYATLVAAVSAIGYLIAGFTGTPIAALLVEAVILIGTIMFLSKGR